MLCVTYKCHKNDVKYLISIYTILASISPLLYGYEFLQYGHYVSSSVSTWSLVLKLTEKTNYSNNWKDVI